MDDAEQKEFLIATMVLLLQRLIVYQSLVDWLKLEVGVPLADIDQVLNSARLELAKEKLDGKLRSVVESSLQAAGMTLDSLLASAFSQWKPKGKPN